MATSASCLPKSLYEAVITGLTVAEPTLKSPVLRLVVFQSIPVLNRKLGLRGVEHMWKQAQVAVFVCLLMSLGAYLYVSQSGRMKCLPPEVPALEVQAGSSIIGEDGGNDSLGVDTTPLAELVSKEDPPPTLAASPLGSPLSDCSEEDKTNAIESQRLCRSVSVPCHLTHDIYCSDSRACLMQVAAWSVYILLFPVPSPSI